MKNKNNSSNDDTESLSGSSYNLKLDSENSFSQTAKVSTFGMGFHKKSVNIKHSMWNTQEVDKFYSLLEFLGADFSLISSFLKTKTIGQIKVTNHIRISINYCDILNILRLIDSIISYSYYTIKS